jgi:hypothetical protein
MVNDKKIRVDKKMKSRLIHLLNKLLDRTESGDYREHLFDELREYTSGFHPKRILEIGPKDGKDTVRLLTLEPECLVLIDLPIMREHNAKWLEGLKSSKIEYISANLMYSSEVEQLEPFDCIWCTGVLYHNPEQLRMIRRLYDLLYSQGVLVMESATIRNAVLRDHSCVEIVYPPSEKYKLKHHISVNVTHMPSARAMEAWLKMVGFQDVRRCECHKKQSRSLANQRAAFLCRRGKEETGEVYYSKETGEKYFIGRSR